MNDSLRTDGGYSVAAQRSLGKKVDSGRQQTIRGGEVDRPATRLQGFDWRIAALLVGYGSMALVGLSGLAGSDSIVLVAGALAGVLFLHRTVLPVLVWTSLLVLGAARLSQADTSGLFEVAASVMGGSLVLSRRRGSAVIAPPRPVSAPPVAAAPDSPVAAAPTAAVEPLVHTARVPVQHPQETPETASHETVASPVPIAEPVAAAVPGALPEPGSAPIPSLQIRTIGTIELVCDGVDLTSTLLRRPMGSFLWLYLLVREIETPGNRLSRPSLADELAPKYSEADQLRTLRDHIRNLRQLPQHLAERLLADEERVGLDLTHSDIDVHRLRRMAATCREADGRIGPDLLPTLEELLKSIPAANFLPGWEAIEDKVTGGAGVAGEHVAAMERLVDAWRSDVVGGFAAACLGTGKPARAQAALVEQLRRNPEREDLIRHLINVYIESGQPRRADEIRRRHQAGEDLFA